MRNKTKRLLLDILIVSLIIALGIIYILVKKQETPQTRVTSASQTAAPTQSVVSAQPSIPAPAPTKESVAETAKAELTPKVTVTASAALSAKTAGPGPVQTQTPVPTPTLEPALSPTAVLTQKPITDPTKTSAPTETPILTPEVTLTSSPERTPTVEPTAAPTATSVENDPDTASAQTASPAPSGTAAELSAAPDAAVLTAADTVTPEPSASALVAVSVSALLSDTDTDSDTVEEAEALSSKETDTEEPSADTETVPEDTEALDIETIEDGSLQEQEKTYRIGDTLFFGHFEADADVENGPEPIEWIILDLQENELLLMSKYVLTTLPYHEAKENADWTSCTLRRWLNGDFFTGAFSESEKDKIVPAGTDGTADPECADRVFILSRAELIKYLPAKSARVCYPTQFAAMQGAKRLNGAGAYWLRDNSRTHYGQIIMSDGSAVTSGVYVNDTYVGVRPCIRVSGI